MAARAVLSTGLLLLSTEVLWDIWVPKAPIQHLCSSPHLELPKTLCFRSFRQKGAPEQNHVRNQRSESHLSRLGCNICTLGMWEKRAQEWVAADLEQFKWGCPWSTAEFRGLC